MVGSSVWKSLSPTPTPASGERVQQRRLAGVRVAGERDRAAAPSARAGCASARAVALGALEPAAAAAAIRSRARRRSVSIWDSPGPARADRRRRAARGGSTGRACARGCTRAGRARPGACPRRDAAWSAKMSRMIARAVDHRHARSPPRGCAPGAARARRRRRSGSRPSARSPPSAPRACPCRDRRSGPGCGAALDHLAGDRDAGGAQQLLQLGEVVAARARGATVARGGRTAMQTPAGGRAWVDDAGAPPRSATAWPGPWRLVSIHSCEV